MSRRDDGPIILATIGVVLIGVGYFLKNKVVAATRTAQDILDVVAEIDPENNPELQRSAPPAPPGGTWCNKFVAWATAKLGAPIPFGLYGTTANNQIYWLDAGNDGWFPISKADAQAWVINGGLAVATWQNLQPGGASHIALVLPIPGTMQIAQAGASNFNMGPVSKGFGAIQPLFYAHA